MSVSSESIEKIKSLNPSDVLEREGVTLKKVGREYVTHCIWHKDTNPSLTINDDKGLLFCHVCQKSADIIEYVKDRNGINFRDACERISSGASFELVYNDENSESAKKRRQEIKSALSLTESLQMK